MENILVMIGIGGLLLFLLPIKTGKILNIGNETGIIVFAIVIMSGMFYEVWQSYVNYAMDNTIGRIVVYALVGILVCLCMTVLVETFLMIKAVCNTPKEEGTVIILGCKVYGKDPSKTLVGRLDAAIKYLEKYPNVACIVSGGQGEDELISEAQCMQKYLLEHGIKKDRIYVEDQSTSTKENLQYSYQLIKEQGLPQRVILVTSDYHQYRAGIQAKHFHLSYGAVSGKTPWWLLPTFYVRELYAILSLLIIN